MMTPTPRDPYIMRARRVMIYFNWLQAMLRWLQGRYDA